MSSAARLSAEDLSHLAAGGSSLGERLAGDGLLLPDAPVSSEQLALVTEQVATRCGIWCELAASGDGERLGRRLAWSGWDEHMARQALAGVRLAKGSQLPDWVLLVKELSDEALGSEAGEAGKAGASEVPFAPLLQPLVAVARRRLAQRLDGTPAAEIFSAEAVAASELWLLRRLSELGLETLYAEFAAWPRRDYAAFVDEQLRQGLRGLLLGYPVLARLWATALMQWALAVAELLFRIEDGFSALSTAFPQLGLDALAGCVTGVELGLSAAHHGGRTVTLLTFRDGQLVYKPRSLAPEGLFAELLRRCNAGGRLLPMRAPQLLDRGDHGFVEFIAHEPCPDGEALLRYYRRGGQLLCLLYLLDGTDVEEASLVAHGEHPLPIDLETLLQPIPAFSASFSAAQQRAQQWLASSVLSTGLLPSWQGRHDRGGLSGGSSGVPHPATLATEVHHPNSDQMLVSEHERLTAPGRNRVQLGSLSGPPQSVRAPEHEHELLAGFAELFRFAMSERESLDSLLAHLPGLKTRLTLRDPQLYQALLRRSLGPALLRDGVDRSLFLESLAERYLDPAERPPDFPLLAAELAAVEQLDIPRFSQAADPQPARERLARLSEAELARQVELIQTALHAPADGRSPSGCPAIESGDWPSARSELASAAAAMAAEAGLEDAQAIAHLRLGATRIARELAQRAVHGDDGTATWHGVVAASAPRRYRHEPLPMDLASGQAGVALFLAAQAQQSGDPAIASLRQAASLHLRKWLADPGRGEKLGLGALTGLGSLLYALARTAQLSGDHALTEDALRVLSFFTPERIAADQALDLTAGAAGAILGLLALHEGTGEGLALDYAVRCGEHLLLRQVEGNSRRRAWPFFLGTAAGPGYGTPLTGFSHGAAGISFALARLYRATRNERFDNASLDGLTYERALQSAVGGNWPDLRPGAARRYACSWAHGAPGIGLSRLGMLAYADGDRHELERELEVALTASEREPWDGLDALDDGNFGRLELLLKAGLMLRQPPLVEQARQLARTLLARAERTGGFPLFPGHPPYLYSPCFFTGTAGIGYELLRLAAPGELPSVLLFE